MAAPLPVSRLFASLQPGDMTTVAADELENKPGIVVGQKGGREVQVTGTAELSAAPDRARVCIRVSSSKGAAAEARSSVLRRLGYIEQTLRQTGLTVRTLGVSYQDHIWRICPEGKQDSAPVCLADGIEQSQKLPADADENITVSKEIERKANAYQMDAEVAESTTEVPARASRTDVNKALGHLHTLRKDRSVLQDQQSVCVVFEDFEKLQNICNILVEKLDSSVWISSPQFYHSPENMEQLRRQVCLNAVSNARRKAQDVCRLVGQSLGKAIIIKEEEMKEWEDQEDCASSSIQHKIKRATVYAASKVSATFEIKGKERNKKSC